MGRWVEKWGKEERKWLWSGERTLGFLNIRVENSSLHTDTYSQAHTHTNSALVCNSFSASLLNPEQLLCSLITPNAALHLSPSFFFYPILLLLSHLSSQLLPLPTAPLSYNPAESIWVSYQSSQVHTYKHKGCPAEIKTPNPGRVSCVFATQDSQWRTFPGLYCHFNIAGECLELQNYSEMSNKCKMSTQFAT